MQEMIRKLIGFFSDDLRRGEINGDLYLTNSKMLIKIPGAASVFPNWTRDLSSGMIERVWLNARESEEFELVEKICALAPAPIACEHCKGTGLVKICPDCNGEGELYCFNCDHTYDCKTCNGKGLHSSGEKEHWCDECDGSGQKLQTIKVFNQIHFNLAFLRTIAEVAPGAVIFKPRDSNFPAFFKNDQISGIIAPTLGVQ